MIDLPPLPSRPPAEALADCGLDTKGFTVAYDELADGYVINISTHAGASKANLQCVWDATWPEFVQFEDRELKEKYDKLSQSRFGSMAMQSAKESLEKNGLLEKLPKRADFSSTAEFAIAIEQLCGFTANQILRVRGDEITIVPKQVSPDTADFERIGCVFSALTASGETKIGIIGNALPATSADQ